jgi:3-hydroxybutyryl-CoA dehydrogenase
MSDAIHKALVIGAGTMGAGIAEVFAKAGVQTFLSDVSEEQLQTGWTRIEQSLRTAVEKGKLTADLAGAARSRIQTAVDTDAASGVDLIVEAVPELMSLKKQIFADLSKKAPNAIIATNTSALSVTEIGSRAKDPSKVVGLHFFNPPPIMPLLEIVRAEQTSEQTIARMKEFATRIGKDPIVVSDTPGFATSRLGVALGLEAIRMLETGVATAADIDRAMELGYKHPMGPLMLTDLVGLEVRLSIADHLRQELGPQFTAPPLLRRLVRAGKLGKKTGEGFYRWIDGKPVAK